MGINVLNNTSSQEIRMPTGPIPVASGDLVLNSDAGVAYVASTALTSAQNNYASAPSTLPTSLSGWTNITSQYTGDVSSNFNMSSMAQLSNGTIAFAYSGNSTSNRSTNVNLIYKLIDGTNAVGNVTVSTGTAYQTIVRRMTTIGATVVWNDGTNINFAIYSNTGTAVKTTTAVGANTSTQQQFNSAVLTNGYLVVAFRETSSGDFKFRIYDTTGTLVGSTVTVEAGSSPSNICVVAQSNGNFVVYYLNGGSSIVKFARYNSSGTLQGALTTVRSSVSAFVCGNLDYLCIELTNGNLVMQATNASAFPVWYMYDSSGTSVVGATNWYNDTAYQNSTYLCASAIGTLVASSSGFLAAGRGQQVYFATYDLNGGQTKTRSTFSQPSNPSTYQIGSTTGYACNIVSLGNWGYAGMFGGPDNCGGNNYLYFCVRSVAGSTSFTGGTIGADISLGPGVSYPDYSACLILTADGSCAMSANFNPGTGYVYWGTYAVQKRSITGVAQEAISTNSTGRVATYGTQPLRLTYTSGGAFNNTSATVPGAKGSYIGGTAVLNGIVA